ncbi:MAG: response regulator transcription factor [Clostridium sp.]
MDKINILVVDDEREITDAIDVYLSSEGYRILKAYTGIEALNILEKENVQLILMDIMMPELDGIRATSKIREKSEIPIIMLSAKSEDTDKVLGLNIGADDYITKPFNPIELIARVKSQLRRYMRFSSISPVKVAENTISCGGLELKEEEKRFLVDGEDIKLTPTEYKIVNLLIRNQGRVFSIEEIYERVWGDIAYNVDTVTVHIKRIREKIEINPKEPRYLKVVWGIGYKIEKQ